VGIKKRERAGANAAAGTTGANAVAGAAGANAAAGTTGANAVAGAAGANAAGFGPGFGPNPIANNRASRKYCRDNDMPIADIFLTNTFYANRN